MNMNILAVDTTTYSTFDFLADGETEKESQSTGTFVQFLL